MDVRTYVSLKAELEKISFDWERAKEGIKDEGIPLAGATLGAYLGKGIRGSAMGYAAGGLGQIGLNKLMHRDDPNKQRNMAARVLGASAIGYGLGGGAHALGEHLTKGLNKRNPGALMARAFHGGEGSRLKHGVEELFPAIGATTATGIAMGTGHSGAKKAAPQPTQPLQKPAMTKLSFEKGGSSGVNTFVNETYKKGAGAALEAARKSKVQALMSRPVAALRKLSSAEIVDGALSLFR
jgi:hypothetical protein